MTRDQRGCFGAFDLFFRGNSDNEIAGLRAACLGELLHILRADQFLNRRGQPFRCYFYEICAARVERLGLLRQLVKLLARIACRSRGGKSEDMAFDLQFFLCRDWETRRHFMQFHSKAHVRFVAAVRSNSILIQHVRERRFGLDACDSTSTHHHVFDHAEDVFLPWK